jgi:hypothetical protein
MATYTAKPPSGSANHAGEVLGRSPATGRLVLKPASKGGAISIRAAQLAARNVRNGHKK